MPSSAIDIPSDQQQRTNNQQGYVVVTSMASAGAAVGEEFTVPGGVIRGLPNWGYVSWFYEEGSLDAFGPIIPVYFNRQVIFTDKLGVRATALLVVPRRGVSMATIFGRQ